MSGHVLAVSGQVSDKRTHPVGVSVVRNPDARCPVRGPRKATSMNNHSRAASLLAHEKIAWVAKVDSVAKTMEDIWGIGRLQRLVTPDLAARFQNQLELWNECVWDDKATIPQIRETAEATIRGWQALDQAAVATGCPPLHPDVWEIPLPDGSLVGLVKTGAEAHKIQQTQSGRFINVWTISEIAAVVTHHPSIVEVKNQLPGAKVTQVRSKIPPSQDPLNDDIPF